MQLNHNSHKALWRSRTIILGFPVQMFWISDSDSELKHIFQKEIFTIHILRDRNGL